MSNLQGPQTVPDVGFIVVKNTTEYKNTMSFSFVKVNLFVSIRASM